jgi:UDP-2,4-diacetamido-2,4,6-trideoxy-beta-L-altropyranose hydrolase
MAAAAARAARLRPATTDDAEHLWAWRNDADTRSGSFRSEEVPWETHVRWLETRLGRSTPTLWILEVDGAPAGQARVERRGQAGEISFGLAPEFRGRGLGPVLLDLAAAAACAVPEIAVAVGFVKSANHASVRTFERAGFAAAATGTTPDGQPFIRFERRCAE